MNSHINHSSGVIRFVLVIAAAALLLAACGKAAETIVENVAAAQTDGKLDISDDGNSISYQSENGSGSISVQPSDNGETGTISGTDAEGNEFKTSIGGSEIPANFPMPIFDPSEVTGVITTESSVGNAYIIKLEISPADADAAIAFYNDWFEAEGLEIVATLDIGLGSIMAGSDTVAANISIIDGPTVEVLLTWTPIG